MIRQTKSFLNRFRKDEDGQMIVEFALAIPLLFMVFLTSVELGIYAMRQQFLDRGLDMAIRDVRLTTGQNLSHDDVKNRICEYSGFLPDCEASLKLEMTPINPRSFAGFSGPAECADVSLAITPSQTFVHGDEHQLMLMRACYVFEPVFPSTGLGKSFTTDENGRVAMFSLSAFVQEPRS